MMIGFRYLVLSIFFALSLNPLAILAANSIDRYSKYHSVSTKEIVPKSEFLPQKQTIISSPKTDRILKNRTKDANRRTKIDDVYLTKTKSQTKSQPKLQSKSRPAISKLGLALIILLGLLILTGLLGWIGVLIASIFLVIFALILLGLFIIVLGYILFKAAQKRDTFWK